MPRSVVAFGGLSPPHVGNGTEGRDPGEHEIGLQGVAQDGMSQGCEYEGRKEGGKKEDVSEDEYKA